MMTNEQLDRLIERLDGVIDELQGIDQRLEWLCDKLYPPEPPQPIEGTISAAIKDYEYTEQQRQIAHLRGETLPTKRTDTSHLGKQKKDADRFNRLPIPSFCNHEWTMPSGQNQNQASHYNYKRICTKCGKEERTNRF